MGTILTGVLPAALGAAPLLGVVVMLALRAKPITTLELLCGALRPLASLAVPLIRAATRVAYPSVPAPSVVGPALLPPTLPVLGGF